MRAWQIASTRAGGSPGIGTRRSVRATRPATRRRVAFTRNGPGQGSASGRPGRRTEGTPWAKRGPRSANYTRDNHGLFADLGLARLTAFLPFTDQAGRWRALARARFESTLRRRLSQGVWLEHSSAYQFLAIRPLDVDAVRARARSRARRAARPDARRGDVVREAQRRDDPVRRLELEPGSRLGPGRAARDAGVLRRRLRLRPRAGRRRRHGLPRGHGRVSQPHPQARRRAQLRALRPRSRASSATPASTTRTRAGSATTWSPTAPTAASWSTGSTSRSPIRASPTDRA